MELRRELHHSKYVGSLGATQGVAYGRNRYKGPKPPFKLIHTYVFTVYVLNCRLDLDAGSTRREFLKAVDGHVMQQSTLSGKFQSFRME